MSAVIPFPYFQTRAPRDPEAAYIASAGKAVDKRTVFVRATVRGHCHVRHYSETIMARATAGALTQVANGQTQDYAITYGCDLAERLHKAEVDAAWAEDVR